MENAKNRQGHLNTILGNTMTKSREIDVCSLKNPEDFRLISINIKTMLGCNFYYVRLQNSQIMLIGK